MVYLAVAVGMVEMVVMVGKAGQEAMVDAGPAVAAGRTTDRGREPRLIHFYPIFLAVQQQVDGLEQR